MIYDIRREDYTIIKDRLALYFTGTSALGMQTAVQCSEEFPFTTLEDVQSAVQGVQPQIGTFYINNFQSMFAVCDEWKFARPDPRENIAVSSDIPTLIFAGDQDPITPPDWGQMVAQDLSNAYFYEFAGNGHWVTRSSDCAMAMALAFWNDPTVDPGAVCQH